VTMSSTSHNGSEAGHNTSPQPVLLQALEGHQGAIYDLCLTSNGDLVSAGGDGLLVLWAKSGQGWTNQGKAVAKAAAPLFTVCTNEGGMLAGTGDGGILSLAPGGEWEIKPAHPGGTYVVTPEATGGADGQWRTWPDGQALAHLAGRVRCSLSTDEGTFVGTSEGTIHHIASGAETTAHVGAVRAMVMWPGKSALASVGGDGRLCIWRTTAGGKLESVLTEDAHKGAVYRMVVSPDGRWVGTCSRDKSIALWNADTLALETRIVRPHWQGHTRSINAMVWSGNGTLATAGDDGRILIWGFSR
jgi:WD40 repeat protein